MDVASALAGLLGQCHEAAHAPPKSDQQHAQEPGGLLQRSRDAGQVLKQDNGQDKDKGKAGQDQQQGQQQQGQQSAGDKEAAQEQQGHSWQDRVGKTGPQPGESWQDFVRRGRGQSSEGNEGSSGTSGNQDGYVPDENRNLPDEQQQEAKGKDHHSRGR